MSMNRDTKTGQSEKAKKGFFLSFEGGEATGKSTQANLLYRRLSQEGEDVRLFREPGSTNEGEQIRKLLLERNDCSFVPDAELLLFYAARAQLLAEEILPALAAGATVICDRFKDSTMAYQHYGRALAREKIESLDRLFVEPHLPDLTIFLSLDSDLVRKRLKERGKSNKMDGENEEFFSKVAAGYRSIYEQRKLEDPQKVASFSGDQAPELIHAQIYELYQQNRNFRTLRGGERKQ